MINFWQFAAMVCAGLLVGHALVEWKNGPLDLKIAILAASGISFGVFLAWLT